MEKVILQLFSERLQTHPRAWNGKWRGLGTFCHNFHSLVLHCPSLGDVILLETQDLSQVCLYTSRGWNTLPVRVTKHQG